MSTIFNIKTKQNKMENNKTEKNLKKKMKTKKDPSQKKEDHNWIFFHFFFIKTISFLLFS